MTVLGDEVNTTLPTAEQWGGKMKQPLVDIDTVAHSLSSSLEGNEYPWHYVQSFLDLYLIMGRS